MCPPHITATALVAFGTLLSTFWIIGDRSRDVRASLKTVVAMAALLIPIQILAGGMHGLNTLEHQPEGRRDGGKPGHRAERTALAVCPAG